MHTMFKELATSTISIFHREKGLVITRLLGFVIAAFAAVYMFLQGEVILPEGNIKNVFSFTAAVGIFLLSIAAILPWFSRVGGLVDILAGVLFGAVSLTLVILGILLTVQFLKKKDPLSRPVLIIGIRYALLSVFIANLWNIYFVYSPSD